MVERRKIEDTKINSTFDRESNAIVDSVIRIDLSVSERNDTYQLFVEAPIPPAGINTATITIEKNIDGVRERQIIQEYVYQNVCAPPAPPPEIKEGEEEEEDNTKAYESCIEQEGITELFCEQQEFREVGFLNAIFSIELEGRTKSEGKIIYPGTIIKPVVVLKGSGYYNLSIVGVMPEDQSEEFLFDERRGIETLDVDYILQPEVTATSTYEKIFVRLQLNNTEGEITLTEYEEYEIYKRVTPPPAVPEIKRILELDADLSDANKETYFSRDIVADVNFDLRTDTEFETTIKDNYRTFLANYWIRDAQSSDNLVLRKKPTEEDKSPELLENTIESYELSGSFGAFRYNDFCYVQERPYLPKEVNFDRVELCTALILDVKKEYNYYYKEYENVLSSFEQINLEPLFPNMYYILYADKILFEREQDTLQNSKIVNSGRMGLKAINNTSRPDMGIVPANSSPYSYPTLDRDIVSCLLLKQGNRELSIQSQELAGKDWYKYFILNRDRVNYTLSDTTNGSRLFQKAKNIIIPYSGLSNLDKFSKQNQLFPMMIDIKFGTEKKRDFYVFLNNFNLAEKFFVNCVSKFINNDPTEIKRMAFVKQQMDGRNARLYRTQNRFIDVTDIANVSSSGSIDNFVYLGDYQKYTEISSSGQDQNIISEKINEKLQEIIKYRARSYDSILQGRKCYKETVFYKIEKRNKSSNPQISDAIIQSIYIANDKTKDTMRYIDTQVMYDKNYLYTIYSYDIVIGNEISTAEFSNIADDSNNTPTFATREQAGQAARGDNGGLRQIDASESEGANSASDQRSDQRQALRLAGQGVNGAYVGSLQSGGVGSRSR